MEKLLLRKKWKIVCATLLKEFDHNVAVVDAISKIKLTKYNEMENIVTLECPDKFIVSLLGQIAEHEITESLTSSFGRPIKVEFVIKQEEKEENKNNWKTNLNIDLVFENFFISPDNKFITECGIKSAENPGLKTINPMFIYGPSGVGKTHLLHAIGNSVFKLHPNIKIRFVTTEVLVTNFINAMQRHGGVTADQIVAEYKEIDFLLVDDVQFMEGKTKSREAFFHILNHFIEQDNKHIVFTSDVSPDNLNTFEDRFKTRFKVGIVEKLTVPDVATREKIINNIFEQRDVFKNVDIDSEVALFLAKSFPNNIRELYGALNRLELHLQVMEAVEAMNVSSLKSIILELLPKDSGEPTILKIQEMVARTYKLSTKDLQSKSRAREILNARHIAMYLCRRMIKDATLKIIGSHFGGRDHTTVRSAFTKIDKAISNNPQFAKEVDSIKKKL